MGIKISLLRGVKISYRGHVSSEPYATEGFAVNVQTVEFRRIYFYVFILPQLAT